MKKLILVLFATSLLAGCQTSVQIDSKTTFLNDDEKTTLEIKDEKKEDVEISKDLPELNIVEESGERILKGNVLLKGKSRVTIFDNYFDQPIDPVEYIMFDISESSSDLFMDEVVLKGGGNSFVGTSDKPSIGLGCLEGSKIKLQNFTLGLGDNDYNSKYISEELTSKIMSGAEVEVEIYFETNTGGRGAPLCYSHVVIQE